MLSFNNNMYSYAQFVHSMLTELSVVNATSYQAASSKFIGSNHPKFEVLNLNCGKFELSHSNNIYKATSFVVCSDFSFELSLHWTDTSLK